MDVTVTSTGPRAWAVAVTTVGAAVTATLTGPGASAGAAERLARALVPAVLQHGGELVTAHLHVTVPRLRRRTQRRAVWVAQETLRVAAPAGMTVHVTRRRVEVRDAAGTVVVGGCASARGTVELLITVGRAALLMRPQETVTVELPEG